MIGDGHLFPLPDPIVAEPVEVLSADRRRTHRHRVMLAAGRHPATGRPLLDPEWGFTCAGCVHAVNVSNGNRSWWKCDRHRLGVSASAASDIRVGWPACSLFAMGAV